METPVSKMDNTSSWRWRLLIAISILIFGAAGGYFRYYFWKHHLQLPGFQYLGRGTYENSKQMVYLFRHEKTKKVFVLIPAGQWQGQKVPAFLISQEPMGESSSWNEAQSWLKDHHLQLPTSHQWHYIHSLEKQGFHFGLHHLPSEWLGDYVRHLNHIQPYVWQQSGKATLAKPRATFPFRGVYLPQKRTGIDPPSPTPQK